MPRTLDLQLAVNGAFCTRRWEEPDNWMRLTRECGFRVHEFCADVIDPFFSGNTEFQLDQARQVREAAERHEVKICDIYTGVATHRFHGLSHSDPRARERMKQWIVNNMDIALAMGTDAIGGHWDALPVEVWQDEQRHRQALKRVCGIFRDLAEIAKAKGLRSIYDEQMYIPSEVPWTLEQCEMMLREINRDSRGVPVYVTVDVGHAAGVHYGATGDDVDYLKWLERFAAVAEIIHLQQTTPDASAHWPFNEHYNRQGHIEMEKVMAAIEQSHRTWQDNPLREVMEPVTQSYLVLEVIPGSTHTEERVLTELKESADYLHQFVPEEGLQLSVP
ncbi:MAG: sugar phosphate isomerase/epimerase family protein [Armatimonadota bacterium]